MKHYHTVFTWPFLLVSLLFLLPAANTITYQVTGTLTDKSEAPVAGHQVYLYNAEDERLASDVTDDQGRFNLAYQVEVTSADPFGGKDTPSEFELGASYPNPFNPRTTVPFYAPENTRAEIAIYTILGQEVMRTRADLNAGSHQIAINFGGALSQGQYLLRVMGDGFSLTRPMTFLSAGISGGTPGITVRSGGSVRSSIATGSQALDASEMYRIVVEGSTAFVETQFEVPALQDHDAGTIELTKMEYLLDVTIEGEGTVEEEIVTAKEYEHGTVVRLTAVPADGWDFLEWSGDAEGDSPVVELTIDEAKEVTATFVIREYPLNITIEGLGTVEEEIVTAKSYEHGTVVRLTAVPADGWDFLEWSGDAEGDSPVAELTIVDEKNVTASFEFRETLVVEVTNPQSGRIWMDRNLGAGRLAVSSTDSMAYGYLYQWGRSSDGHQLRTSPTTTTMLSSTDEPGHGNFILNPESLGDWRDPQNNDLWQGVDGINNPCPEGFRLPTEAEWNEERNTWDSLNAAAAFESPLNLTVSGLRNRNNGSLAQEGSTTYYWSSTVSNTLVRVFHITPTAAFPTSIHRASGFPVRCMKDFDPPRSLNLQAYPSEGGSVDGAGVYIEGDQVEILATASEGFFFVNWSGDIDYVTNANARSTTVIMPGRDITLTAHFEEMGETEVVEVLNPATGRTWMDRNLGASRAATSTTDTEAKGDLYQWGRAADGHQIRLSDTTSTLSTTDQPGHGKFIVVNESPEDWRIPQNFDLWQGVDGVNNPCPSGFRLPTELEWEAERESWVSNDSAGAFASPLKLPTTGFRSRSSGTVSSTATFGYYWTSNLLGTRARRLSISSTNASMGHFVRASGYAVRCIKDVGDGNDMTEVVEVTNPGTGRVWMDRNLGATRAAIASGDEHAYGDLYQWGRADDGHQLRSSSTETTLSITDQPDHGRFIRSSGFPGNWRSSRNDNLWQGLNGTNNPCPLGFRIPTEAEWDEERETWDTNNTAGAFSSLLKLTPAGRRDENGGLDFVGERGRYWTSTTSVDWARMFMFDESVLFNPDNRAVGNSIRCIKD